MSDIKRITPDEVKAAYAKTGLGVHQGDYISADAACACGLGAYAIAFLDVDMAAEDTEDEITWRLSANGFSYDYIKGFGWGFDGRTRKRGHVQEDIGRDDGIAAWEAVKEDAS